MNPRREIASAALSSIGTANIARAVLLAATTLLAACTPGADQGSSSQFVITTQDGNVLGEVHGSSRGLTNAGLVRLVKAGIAQRYQLQCARMAELSPGYARLDWIVTGDGRKPTSVLIAKLLKDNSEVKAASMNIVAPNAAPDIVFIHDVSVLSSRILPPGRTASAAATDCT